MLAGSLPPEQQEELTTHLDTCLTCRQTLDELATEGESWSELGRKLGHQPAAHDPALEQAIQEIKGDFTSPLLSISAGTAKERERAGGSSADDKRLDFLSPPGKAGCLGRLAHYDVTEVIGRGGMGIVLKAFDSALHRVVAIKVLAPQLATSAAARKRFLREARAAAAVTHDHIVTIHAVDEFNGIPYLVMQFISGMSLQERLDRTGTMDVKEILRIGMQTAQGLAAAHAQGLIHRDIKPANVLLENGVERVKITDFGLARAVDEASQTQSGVVAGTPQYMAPEQARGEALDHRADLFSLGSVLYAMCAGRPPFRAESTMAVLRRVSEDTPRSISDINPEIPSWLIAIIAKLHTKEPKQRYQSAGEVAEALGQHLDTLQKPVSVGVETATTGTESPDAKPQARRSRRFYWGTAATILLALLIGVPLGGYYYTDWRVRTLPDSIRRLEKQKPAEMKAVTEEERGKHIKLAVTGPSSFQQGAPNEFVIETRDLNDKPVPVKLAVRLMTDSKKEGDEGVLGKWTAESTGTYRLAAPTSLGWKTKGNLSLEVTAEKEGEGEKASLTEQLPLLGAAYVTHLTTDKPMYRPGEVVGFRSLTLDSFTRKPADEDLRLIFTITDGNGQQVYKIQGPTFLTKRPGSEQILTGPDGKPIRGIGAGEYAIHPNAPGGEYTLTVREALDRFAPQQRKFVVNKYEKPRLNKELEFTRKSYGPGEEVLAGARVRRIEGGIPVADQPVTATVQVDGKSYRADGKEEANASIPLKTDANGAVSVSFRLPAQIDRGEASLALRFTDGANVETIVRPIPIVLNKLQVEFFAEGGDLVAGVPNRVYFQARTMLDKPAELKGRVVDDHGKVITEIKTLNVEKEPGINQGMGRFEFTPVAQTAYELKIVSPSGIQGKYSLPEAKKDGIVLNIPETVIGEDQPLRVILSGGMGNRKVAVGVYYHGRLVALEYATVSWGRNTDVIFKFLPGPGGVYRVTVFKGEDQPPRARARRGESPWDIVFSPYVPAAERLIYRKPSKGLQLAIQPDKQDYIPGEKVKITCKAADESGKAAPAILLVGVVDQGVLSLADEKTYRGMPTHFYLTNEVRRPEDLEFADVLLGAKPQAAEALDLLLGTQGWRRFAEVNPAKIKEKQPQDGERLLASLGETPVVTTNQEKIEETVLPEIEKKVQARLGELASEEKALRSELWAAKDRLSTYEQVGRALATIGIVLVVVGAVVGIIAGLIWLASRHKEEASAISTLLACGLIVGLCIFMFQFGGCGLDSKKGSFPRSAYYKDKAAMPSQTEDSPMEDRAGGGGMMERAQQNMETMKSMLKSVEPKAPEAVRAPGGKDEFTKGLTGRPPAKEFPLLDETAPGLLVIDDRSELVLKTFRQREDLVSEWGVKPPAGRKFKSREGEAPAVPVLPRGSAGASPSREAGPPLLVREYAHRRADHRAKTRSDFIETVYWNPTLVLSDGEAFLDFDLSDAITSYQVRALGHTLDGRLGELTATIQARKPFSVEPKIPIEVTNNDKIDLPVTVANDTNTSRAVEVQVGGKNLELLRGQAQEKLELSPNQRKRLVFRFQPTVVEGEAQLAVAGECEPFLADRIARTIQVVPEGFPMQGSSSDVLDQIVRQDLVLPESWLKGTMKLTVRAYPSILADLQTGLDSMLREPHGCFEQTSSSNYPNLLILDYLRENNQANPDLTRRARQLLTSGYQQLVSFECSNREKNRREGYEWFGGAVPPHEALTAYGLLEFRDMSRVHDVDKVMVERTRNFLMDQRDGKGGFKRNPRSLDHFGRAPENVTNAYIVWALTESGPEDDLEQEIKALTEQAKVSKDSYFLALVANSLLNRNKKTECAPLLKALADAQHKDGFIDGAQTSIVASGGRDLQIETTALAVLAWIKANPPKRTEQFRDQLQAAAKWLTRQRGGFGGFGSTQATVLALKALTSLSRTAKTKAGELILHVGDQDAVHKKFTAGAQEVLTLELPDPERYLKPGKNKLRLESIGDNEFPYTVTWSYQTLKPPSAENCAVKLSTRLDKTTAAEGETVRLTAVVENRKSEGQGMTVAILGLPAGLTLPEDMKQLKDLTSGEGRGVRGEEELHPVPPSRPSPLAPRHSEISAWEIRGRELILYWRGIGPGERIEVNLDLICRVPGEYRGPASRAYLYYNADDKCWTDPLQMTIKARQEN
jgi:serine/threonine protein kinase